VSRTYLEGKIQVVKHMLTDSVSQILSTFDNGRVEGFLDMRTLTPEDMTHPAMAVKIARRLKQFHTAPITLHGASEGKAEPFKTLWEWCALGAQIELQQ
jgi:hypothetical protein